ncbi:hypothetical protein bcCo53_001343 (plasmid) [Borrelia coriaceae]|nr:hypothetical protein bcCo53_001343 [Borrelia coriaceae]
MFSSILLSRSLISDFNSILISSRSLKVSSL